VSNNPNSDAHGWMNWTSNKNNQQTNEQRITELEKKWRTHLGIDFAASGADYPHPSQKVRALYFFEGNGRLDPSGIQILNTDTLSEHGMWWVSEFTDTPIDVAVRSSITGYASPPNSLPTSTYVVIRSADVQSSFIPVAEIINSVSDPGSLITLETVSTSGIATLGVRSDPDTTSAPLCVYITNAPLALGNGSGSDFTAVNGSIWYLSGTGRIRARMAGANYNLATTDDIPTTMNKQPYAAKTTTYTTTNADGVISVDATSASFTVTLVTAVGNSGLTQTFKKINAANVVTIDANSTQTIDGVTTYALSARYSWVTVISDGANWMITGAG